MPVAIVTVTSGTKKVIEVSDQDMQDTWSATPTYIHHKKNIKGEFSKTLSHLTVGSYYKLTFEIFDYISCQLQVRIGDSQYSDTYLSAGIKTFYFKVNTDKDKIITFISDGNMKIANIKTYERKFQTTPVSFSDPTQFENKSWSISYSFKDGWTGFHSYIPNYYFHNQNNFYALVDNKIWAFNSEDKYQSYFGVLSPFIVEYVANHNPVTEKIFEQLSLHTKARIWDAILRQYRDQDQVTFNKITCYNSRQSTGELNLVTKESLDASSWYSNATANLSGSILINKTNNIWNLNQFRDYVVDYSQPLFSAQWEDIQDDYYIDKVVNTAAISLNKHWQQLQSLRDKFMVIRLKFDIFDNTNLLLNYTLETEQVSIR